MCVRWCFLWIERVDLCEREKKLAASDDDDDDDIVSVSGIMVALFIISSSSFMYTHGQVMLLQPAC